jgi:hypothetical protein
MYYSVPCTNAFTNAQKLIPQANVGNVNVPDDNQSPDIHVPAGGATPFTFGWQYPPGVDASSDVAFFFQGSYPGHLANPTDFLANDLCNAQYNMVVSSTMHTRPPPPPKHQHPHKKGPPKGRPAAPVVTGARRG